MQEIDFSVPSLTAPPVMHEEPEVEAVITAKYKKSDPLYKGTDKLVDAKTGKRIVNEPYAKLRITSKVPVYLTKGFNEIIDMEFHVSERTLRRLIGRSGTFLKMKHQFTGDEKDE